MSPGHQELARDFLEVIAVCQGALHHIHFYLAILILTTQISTSYGHPIGTYSQGLPIGPSSISGSPSVKTSSTYVDSLSVMFLRNVPVAIIVNSKGQIVGTLSSEFFKATAQQTNAKIPSLTAKTQSAKSVAVKSTPISKKNKDVAVSAAINEITVVKPNDLTKTRTSTPGKVMAVGKVNSPSLMVKTQSAKSVAVKSTSISKTNKDLAVSAGTKEITVVKPNDLTKTRTSTPVKVMGVGKAISVKETAAKVIVSQNSSSLKAKALNTNEPVAVLNNSVGAGNIGAKTAQATYLERTSQSAPAKMMKSAGVKSATNITTTTIAAGNVTNGTQWSASTTFSPANTTVSLANTTVSPTNITSPTQAAAAFLEGLEYGEDYTTTPAPAPLLMGEGGELLEPEEVIAAEPVELR